MIALLLAALLSTQESLNDSEFRKLHDALKPPGSELWRDIPWKVSLLEAQNAAAREKKPIFIWSMDGNPLGCG